MNKANLYDCYILGTSYKYNCNTTQTWVLSALMQETKTRKLQMGEINKLVHIAG
jgi:hypothetical protein